MGDPNLEGTPGAPSRRTLLRGAVLAGVAVPVLAACGSDSDSSTSTPTTSDQTTSAASSGGKDPAPSTEESSSSSSAVAAVATKSDVPEGGGVVLGDDGVVITQPAAGTFNGFSSTCTHMGCTLADVTTTINCGCHGSQFSIEDGSVVTGPATLPLPAKKLKISGDDIALA